jgi:hypothetical protein
MFTIGSFLSASDRQPRQKILKDVKLRDLILYLKIKHPHPGKAHPSAQLQDRCFGFCLVAGTGSLTCLGFPPISMILSFNFAGNGIPHGNRGDHTKAAGEIFCLQSGK